MPGNEDAEKIYIAVHDQLILNGIGGVIALNHMAIHAAMDLYEIQDKKSCFEKIVALYRTIIELENKKEE